MTDITNGAIGIMKSPISNRPREFNQTPRAANQSASKKQQDKHKAQAHSNATKKEIEEFQAANENRRSFRSRADTPA